jgi:hypothetical protein
MTMTKASLSAAARKLGASGSSKGGISRMERHYPNSPARKKFKPSPPNPLFNRPSTEHIQPHPVFRTIIDGNKRLGLRG